MKAIKFILIVAAVLSQSVLNYSQSSGPQLPNVDHNFVKITFGDNIYTDGLRGSIFHSSNVGEEWTPLNPENSNIFTERINDYDQFNEYSTGIAVSSKGTYYLTTNSGESFDKYTLENNDGDVLQNINKVASTSPNIFYLCGDMGLCQFSIDGGNSWQSIYTGIICEDCDYEWDDLVDIYPIDENAVFVLGKRSLHLILYGVVVQQTVFEKRMSAVTFTEDLERGYLVGEGGYFACSSDRGMTWQQIESISVPAEQASDLNDVLVKDNGMIITVGDNGTVLIYDPSANTFEPVDLNTTKDLSSVDFRDSETGMIVGNDGAAYLSLDNGLNWQEVLFKGPSSGILPTQPGNSKQNSTANHTTLQQNYPNPFNPSTRISFSLPVDSKVSIKIYDLTGREVVTLTDGFRSAGSYSVEFNASGLASGVYFYTIKANSFSETKRMILTK